MRNWRGSGARRPRPLPNNCMTRFARSPQLPMCSMLLVLIISSLGSAPSGGLWGGSPSTEDGGIDALSLVEFTAFVGTDAGNIAGGGVDTGSDRQYRVRQPRWTGGWGGGGGRRRRAGRRGRGRGAARRRAGRGRGGGGGARRH